MKRKIIWGRSTVVNGRYTGVSVMGILKKLHPMAILAIVGTLITYALLLGERPLVAYVAGKEALLEDLSALLMLVASVLCFAARSAARRRSRARRACYLLLGFFFFVAFGEELSWGQQIWKFRAPDSIRAINRQNELNLHNLDIFDSHTRDGPKTGLAALVTSNRLFDYFMATSFVLLPLARRHPKTRGWLERFDAPVVSLAFALPLFLNVALTVAAELTLAVDVFWHLAVSETREFNYAFLCAAGVASLLGRERRRAMEK